MKTVKLLFVALFLNALGYAQNNQSFNVVNPTITPVSPPLTGEIFRFQPGLVTQLQSGSNFDFGNQWFSIGELSTGSQMVYGLRFQLPNKALTFGYQDTNDPSPRVQWIGNSGNQGDLEFRFADSFTSTTSNLVASMTNEGQLILPASNTTGSANIGGVKLAVESDSFRTGIRVNTTQANITGEGVGLSATASFNQSNVSVKGTANGGIGIGGSNIAIQGISTLGFAGFLMVMLP